MIEKDGLLWPAKKKGNAGIRNDAEHIEEFLEKVPNKRTAVQAGGCVGLYPIRIAQQFQLVHTFEPNTESYECLMLNLKGIGNIIPHKSALGDHAGEATMRIVSSIGSHQIETEENKNNKHFDVLGTENVEVCTIDSLSLDDCDLIWLDVEGYEIQVLEGAKETIERCRPVIIVEKAGRGPSSLPWLKDHGYHKGMRINKDHLFLP